MPRKKEVVCSLNARVQWELPQCEGCLKTGLPQNIDFRQTPVHKSVKKLWKWALVTCDMWARGTTNSRRKKSTAKCSCALQKWACMDWVTSEEHSGVSAYHVCSLDKAVIGAFSIDFNIGFVSSKCLCHPGDTWSLWCCNEPLKRTDTLQWGQISGESLKKAKKFFFLVVRLLARPVLTLPGVCVCVCVCSECDHTTWVSGKSAVSKSKMSWSYSPRRYVWGDFMRAWTTLMLSWKMLSYWRWSHVFGSAQRSGDKDATVSDVQEDIYVAATQASKALRYSKHFSSIAKAQVMQTLYYIDPLFVLLTVASADLRIAPQSCLDS